jgi:hypothetical protein
MMGRQLLLQFQAFGSLSLVILQVATMCALASAGFIVCAVNLWGYASACSSLQYQDHPQHLDRAVKKQGDYWRLWMIFSAVLLAFQVYGAVAQAGKPQQRMDRSRQRAREEIQRNHAREVDAERVESLREELRK